MKITYLIAVLVVLSSTSFGQDKIVITYDANGSRILRERVCPSCRPAPPAPISPDKDELSQAEESKLKLLEEEMQFRVYPNPSADEFYISIDAISLSKSCTVVLTDQLGKEYKRVNIKTATTSIATTSLPDGVYYLNIYRGDKKDIVKIVKESGRDHY